MIRTMQYTTTADVCRLLLGSVAGKERVDESRESMLAIMSAVFFCTSLRDLSVEFRDLTGDADDCGFMSDLINRMLEGSGASLTSFSHIHNAHPNLLRPRFAHNTALRHLELSVNVYFTGDWKRMSKRTWLGPVAELRLALSTVRSSQLESITIRFNITLYSCPQTVEELNIPSEKLDLALLSLHSVMVGPQFDTLKGVDARMLVHYVFPWEDEKSTEGPMHPATAAICSAFSQLFEPWSNRGIVNITEDLERNLCQ